MKEELTYRQESVRHGSPPHPDYYQQPYKRRISFLEELFD